MYRRGGHYMYNRSGGGNGPQNLSQSTPLIEQFVSPNGFVYAVPQLPPQPLMCVPVAPPHQRNYNTNRQQVQAMPDLYTHNYNNNKRSRGYRDTFHEGPNKKRLRSSEEECNVNSSPIPDVPVPPKSYDPNSKITLGIWRYFENNRQTDSMYKKKVDLRDALYAIFKEIFPYCGLYMVGSSMSGFATRTSDMDLCLMLSQQEINGKKEALEILLAIQRALHKCRFIKSKQLIRARVPILKFLDSQGNVECDLNINNSVGIRNTHLLRYYAAMDWRVRPLVLFMKKWARFHDINDASKKTISSYSLCLMMIHFLQAGCKPPVLESIQKLYPDLFDYGEDIRNLQMNVQVQFKSKNTESLGDLFLGFLKYYKYDFSFQFDVASTRLGCKLPIHMVKASCPQKDLNSWGCLKVEEPFDLTNTARSCYDVRTFSRVIHVFHKSYNTLMKKRNIESILTDPF